MPALIFILFTFCFSWAQGADGVRTFLTATCAESLVVREENSRKVYSITPTQMATLGDRLVTAAEVVHEGQNQVKVSVLQQGKLETLFLAIPYFRRILLSETSVWFLLDNALLELNLDQRKLVGAHASFPEKFDMAPATRARGFSYQDGRIYVAHGELGVSVFSIKTQQHERVIRDLVQPGSLAAAVEVRGGELFVLQGAFQQNGVHGITLMNLRSGSSKFIRYTEEAGAVDPYNSTMKLSGQSLVVNNSGWIHRFTLEGLARGPLAQRPEWLPVAERLETAGGVYDRYLMIDGDFVVHNQEVLACSSVHYVPVGERKPVRDWRFLQRKL